jgi:hypothetical protein
MKKLLIIAAIAITYASCKKEDTGTPVSTTPMFTAFGIYEINGGPSLMQIQAVGNGPSHGLLLGRSKSGGYVNADMFFRIQFTDSVTFKTMPTGMAKEEVYTFIDTNYTNPVVYIKRWNSVEQVKLKRIL